MPLLNLFYLWSGGQIYLDYKHNISLFQLCTYNYAAYFSNQCCKRHLARTMHFSLIFEEWNNRLRWESLIGMNCHLSLELLWLHDYLSVAYCRRASLCVLRNESMYRSRVRKFPDTCLNSFSLIFNLYKKKPNIFLKNITWLTRHIQITCDLSTWPFLMGRLPI